MREFTSEQRLAYARELGANPILREITEKLMDESVAAWDGTTDADYEARERAWYQRQAVKALLKRIDSIIIKET